jgi:A/G-specific adenine glycosylase
LLQNAKLFYQPVLDWHRKHGRSGLPWQQEISPYRVWVSEIMLQQTRVDTAIPYFLNFLQHFPTLAALAAATEDQVLHHWTGLGYYNRARNMRRTAQQVVEQYGGELPESFDDLIELPGIGRSTAGAILSISMAQRAVILDGNVKRVLARVHRLAGWPGSGEPLKQLWKLAEHYTPPDPPEHGALQTAGQYSQAMMDLGATLCTRHNPQCQLCPVSDNCQALQMNEVTLYPQPKPRKVLPVKEIQFLLLSNSDDEVLLDKRPPVGIWPGLWSLPELPLNNSVEDYCLERLGKSPLTVKAEKPFSHTFSHFKLMIHPVWVDVAESTKDIMEPNRSFWYNPTHSEKPAGLPAPVKKLLQKNFGKE